MYIKKKRGPKIDPGGTPARVRSQSEVFPLRMTLWTLSLRKISINPSKFPLKPFCFNLNNKPSCHSLMKGFDMSKNTPQVSKEELESKLRKMSQESPGKKPDWCIDNKFPFAKNTKSSLKISLSKILLHIGKRGTGL